MRCLNNSRQRRLQAPQPSSVSLAPTISPDSAIKSRHESKRACRADRRDVGGGWISRSHVGRDARNLQIGHSYLLHSGSPVKDLASLKRAIRDDIIPLLEEYCYEDYTTLGKILGEQVIDLNTQQIRDALFDEGQEEALKQALLTPFEEISRTSEAIASEESQADTDEADEADES